MMSCGLAGEDKKMVGIYSKTLEFQSRRHVIARSEYTDCF